MVCEADWLERLYDVVKKLSTIALAQASRFKKLWDGYFSSIDVKPHSVRYENVEQEKFINDIDYRIKSIKNIEDSFVDGYYAIKSILQALYEHYFLDSDLFTKAFTEPDRTILKYMAAREILGNLIQYTKLDHESVPLKYMIIAREYIMMKLKGVSLTGIMNNLKKLKKVVDSEYVSNQMKEVQEDGIISIEEKDGEPFYTIKTELKLTEEGKRMYNSTYRPLVDWPTQFWRSYYNIRELNVTPSSDCPYDDFLGKILTKSATQGFSPAHYVFTNLGKYYQKIKDESS